MSDKVTAFTIDRKTWLRGEGGEASALLRPGDGKMCCLGSYSLACGVSARSIKSKQAVSQMADRPMQMDWLVEVDKRIGNFSSCESASLMTTNDDRYLPDYKRESDIIKKFAEQGITVTFVN